MEVRDGKGSVVEGGGGGADMNPRTYFPVQKKKKKKKKEKNYSKSINQTSPVPVASTPATSGG